MNKYIILKRTCPDCNKELIYKSALGYKIACNKSSSCKSCSQTGNKNPVHFIKNKKEWKKNISNSMKGNTLSDMHKLNISKSLKGRIFSNEWKDKISISASKRIGSKNGMYGKTHSNLTKKKLRLIYIQQLKKINSDVHPMYNPCACKLIDEYGKQNNYNFQHALNGGEYYIKDLGYWVDGYDIEKNVVIEIDEKKHFDRKGNLKKKDVIRQQEIQSHLNCEFIRIKI